MTNWKYLFPYQGIILNFVSWEDSSFHQNRHFFAFLDRREVGIIMRRDLLVIGSLSTTQIKSLSSCTNCLVRTRINELVVSLLLLISVVIKWQVFMHQLEHILTYVTQNLATNVSIDCSTACLIHKLNHLHRTTLIRIW